MRKLLTTSLQSITAFALLIFLTGQSSSVQAQDTDVQLSTLLDHFRVADNLCKPAFRVGQAAQQTLQQARLMKLVDPQLVKNLSIVKDFKLPFGQTLVLDQDLQIFSRGDVSIDGDIIGKAISQSNASGQNLIICAEGTIVLNGNIQLSNGGNGQLRWPQPFSKLEYNHNSWSTIGSAALSLYPQLLRQHHASHNLELQLTGGAGGSLLLQAKRIVINGQIKVGNGGNGTAGASGGRGGDLIVLFEQLNLGHKSPTFDAGDGGQGGDALEWLNCDGGQGGQGGEILFFVCSNGDNGSNGSSAPTTPGGDGLAGYPGGNNTDVACSGGNGGNGGNGGINMVNGNGRRGGAGGAGGNGGIAINMAPGGAALGGNGGNGSNGGLGGNAVGINDNGGRGGHGGNGGAGGAAYGGDGTNGGSCTTVNGGNATGGAGGDGGDGGNGGFGGANGVGGDGGNGGDRGPGGDAFGGDAGYCTAVACTTPSGGLGTGGARGARGVGGTGGSGGTAGMLGNIGGQNPPGAGTAGTDGLCILPIELSAFEASIKDNGVLISWATASELNNDYMALERSANGLDFLEITSVKGKGTTEEAQTYRYFDATPLLGINYYRLRQVDFNGTVDHSKVIAITMDKGELLSIFPNPAKDRVYIQTPLTLVPQQVYLMDVMGRKVGLNLQGTPGWYEIALPPELPAGHYWLRLQEGAKVHRLMVLKE